MNISPGTASDARLWHRISTDWFGKSVSPPVDFALTFTTEHILFSAKRSAPAQCDHRVVIGSFVEGLWEREVAELFICEEGTSRYLEINVSPAGAWWWCTFEKYRIRSITPPAPPPEVRVNSMTTIDSWELSIEIPYKALPLQLSSPSKARLNVTSIIRDPELQYLTWAPLKNDRPDFHLTDQFPPWTKSPTT